MPSTTQDVVTVAAFAALPGEQQIAVLVALIEHLHPNDRQRLLRVMSANSGYARVTTPHRDAAVREWTHLSKTLMRQRLSDRDRFKIDDLFDEIIDALKRGQDAIDIPAIGARHGFHHTHERSIVPRAIWRLRGKLAMHYQDHPKRSPRVQITPDGALLIAT